MHQQAISLCRLDKVSTLGRFLQLRLTQPKSKNPPAGRPHKSQGRREGTSSKPDSCFIGGYVSFHKSIKKQAMATSCQGYRSAFTMTTLSGFSGGLTFQTCRFVSMTLLKPSLFFLESRCLCRSLSTRYRSWKFSRTTKTFSGSVSTSRQRPGWNPEPAVPKRRTS